MIKFALLLVHTTCYWYTDCSVLIQLQLIVIGSDVRKSRQDGMVEIFPPDTAPLVSSDNHRANQKIAMVTTRQGNRNDHNSTTTTPTKNKRASSAKKREPTTPSSRKKNLVTVKKPWKSPSFLPPPKTVAFAQGNDDSSQTSDASSTASRPGISYHVQKQLTYNIEHSGGIQAFLGKNNEQGISNLCNNRADELFGKRGDKLRIQISKKVYRWGVLHTQGLYTDKILNRHSIKSWATLQAEKRNQSNKVASDLSSSGDFDSDSSTLSPISAKKPQKKTVLSRLNSLHLSVFQ